MDVGQLKAPVDFTVMRNDETCLNGLESVGLAGDRYYRPHWVSKETQEYTGSVMVIDPSGRGSDETTWCIAKMYAGNIYVPEIGGSAEGYTPATLTRLAKIAKRHKVNCILIESNFGDGMFSQLLRPFLSKIYPCSVEEVRQHAQKERRIIDTLEPVMMQHRLVIDPKVISSDLEECERDLSYSCFHQISRLTADRGALRHDDRLDALAIAVAYWVEQMDADANALENERQAEELDKFLEEFVVGYGAITEVWMDS